MLIDRTHNRWFMLSTAIVAIGAVAYSVERLSPHGATGGSVLGLIFGIVGSVFMVIAALLAVRKRLPTWRVGSAKAWLRAHLWLGTVGFVLILFHSGFGWGGLLENLLWISFGLVVVTGFAGLALQQVIPKLLRSEVPLETFVAQISFLAKTMLFRADQLVAMQTGPLDVPFEKLTPFATAVLKQQGVLKRESDLPKELAKVYANVPQPEGEKKGHTAEKPVAAPKLTATETPVAATPSAAATSAKPTSEQAAPVTKSKSPLQLMQEKKAAAAKETESKEVASVPAGSVAEATAAKPKSPLELMREKTAAKAAAAGPEATTEPVATPAAQPSEKKLSPLELMRAKQGAKQSPTADTSESPVNETVAERPSEKNLSPVEAMRAKLSAAKGSPSDKPAETPKPLTVAEKFATGQVIPLASEAASAPQSVEQSPVLVEQSLVSDEQATGGLTPPRSPSAVAAPPIVKKPLPISKPVASAENVAATSAAAKPQLVVISPIQIAELRDFHLKIVRPYLDRGISPQHGLNESITARRLFGQLKSDLPAELHEVLEQLASCCEERRQFAVQKRLHRWLHWWLILHIPPSIAMLVLFVAHVLMSLRVVPFGR